MKSIHGSRFTFYNASVNDATVNRLLGLNRQFYQTFAIQFSATRLRLQPGVRRIVESLPEGSRLLDLGCGNGELARALAIKGYQGSYLGLDFSPELLNEARKQIEPGSSRSGFQATFLQADLSSPDWETLISPTPFSPFPWFSFILAFAVLHHLPGEKLRRQILQKAHDLLAPGGRLIHSEWQFLNSPRLRGRIQPWETIGLPEQEVDEGDYLLDWREGGQGLRYVHYFSEAELGSLAEESGFTVEETFLSDGENGRLGLYQTWVKPETRDVKREA